MIRTAILALLLAAGAPGPYRVVEIPPTGRISAIAVEDLDGDGRAEILVWQGKRLTLYPPGITGNYFPGRPQTVTVDPDALLFGVGQVDGDERTLEVVLLTPAGIRCHSMAKGILSPSSTLLIPAANLVTGEQEDEVQPGGFLKDLDGDGLPDVVLPTPAGFALYYQRRHGPGETAPAGTPGKWPDGPDRVLPSTFGSRIQVDPPGLRGRIRAAVAVPAFRLLDADGDGRADVILDDGRTLTVHLREKDGMASALPSERIDLGPLGIGEDPAGFRIEDVNGDGRPDYVVARQGEDRVDVHLGGRPLGEPQVRLPVKGWILPFRILDIDDDGRPDLVVPHTPDFSLPTAISVAFSGAITVNAAVFLNTGDEDAPWRPVPDTVREIRVRIRLFVDDTGRIRTDHSVLMLVEADFDGDGRKDLLLREGTSELLVYPGTADGVFEKDEALSLGIPDTGDCRALDATTRDMNGDGAPDVAIRYVGTDRGKDRLVLLLSERRK